MTIAGLKLIVPTSVAATGAGSSATVSATGKVTFTSAATISVNGCFTSSYDNYLAVCRATLASGSSVLQAVRLRASGTDDTGNNITRQYLAAFSTSVTGARNTSTNAGLIGNKNSGTMSGDHIYFYGPYLTQPTAIRNVNAGNVDSASILDCAFTHSLSSAYDGFTIFPVTSSITGTLTVYGLAE
jgi:hypothetical protein